MNELLDELSPEDGAVIARVRAALDEVTAHAHDHDHDQAHSLVPAEWPRGSMSSTGRRPTLQAQARAELESEQLPVTRSRVTRRAIEILGRSTSPAALFKGHGT